MTEPLSFARRYQLAIGGCVLIALAIAIPFITYFQSGLTDSSIALGAVVCSWFALSRSASPLILPINSYRLTLADLLTLLTICGILYGLSIPSGASIPRGRLQPNAPVPIPTQPADGG
ncbi:hypothetical protein SH449x_003544 [Pirellulaceae bacterium SH449]